MGIHIIYELDADQLERINQVAKFILRKMYFDERIGGRHTAIVNLKKGLPSHFGHYADKAVKSLIKDNYIIKKPTNYGLHVYLNSDKIPDVKRMLGIEE